MAILQLCRWTLSHKKLCSRLFDWSLILFIRTKNAFWATLCVLAGNIRTPSIAGWKARGRPHVRHNFELFSLSLTVETLCGSCRRVSNGWVTERKCHMEGGVTHQPVLVSENWSGCPFVRYQNIRSASFGFVITYACGRRTNRQTGRITTANTVLHSLHTCT